MRDTWAVSFWRAVAVDLMGEMIGAVARRGNVVAGRIAGWTVTQMFAHWIASLRSQ